MRAGPGDYKVSRKPDALPDLRWCWRGGEGEVVRLRERSGPIGVGLRGAVWRKPVAGTLGEVEGVGMDCTEEEEPVQ